MLKQTLIHWHSCLFEFRALKYFVEHLSALKTKINKESWSAVEISWEKNTNHFFFTALPQFNYLDFSELLTSLFFVLITIAKFDCLVSCSTNPNDYLIIRRNRSQIFEALTINPENRSVDWKQTKGKRAWTGDNGELVRHFLMKGTITERSFYSSQ